MLRYLLNFWLFPMFGMFFAAGATIDAGLGDGGGDGAVDNSGGDGDSGGDAGAGDGGDADGSGEADAGTDDSIDESDDADANLDPDAPVDLGDGRQVPGKWKKLFDAAAKAGLGKEAKQLYFAQQRLTKAIPGGINGAIEMARTVEEVGGLEGIQQLQSDLEVHTADAELFENNPSQWAQTGFKENPEAALKAFVSSLDYVAEHHPENYDHLMAKVIVNDLGALPLNEIHGILAGLKDNPAAQRAAKALADYYNSRLETSKKAPEKKPDAQNKAMTDREANVEKREMGVRFTEVNREVFPVLKSSVSRQLQVEAKAAGVDLQKLSKEYPGEWRDLLNDIHKRVMAAAGKDQRFIDKHYALVKKGDLKRATKAVNDKHESVIPDAVRAAVKERGLFRGKKTAKPGADKGDAGGNGNNNANANQGWTRVSKRPERGMVDWAKTSTAMQLDGKYILNDGKKIVVAY